MTKINSTTSKRTFKHLTDIQRGRLEEMAKSGNYTQAEMARELNVSQPTISRELTRGKTRQMASSRKFFDCYLADAGARVYKENRLHCCSKGHNKFSTAFFEELPQAILSTKQKPREHSIDTFVQTYKNSHPEEHVPCTKTVYTLIDQGILPVRNIDLPMKSRLRPRRNQPSEPKGSNKKHLGRSIEERDPSVLTRNELGHWEVDLVLGKKTKGEPVIITMVERQNRFLLTKKVWSKDADTIQKATLQMMKRQGLKYFKSLTTDNGAEFSSLSDIEKNTETVRVFFTHAFASWEKGTNERHNGLLREFLPKGQSLKSLRYTELQTYTDAINNRPRKILDYKTPKESLGISIQPSDIA